MIVGFAIGGIVLMPIAVLSVVSLFNRFSGNASLGFIAIYALALGLGAWAAVLMRRRVDLLSGFVAGASAGLFGLTALCNSLVGTSMR